MGEDLEQPLEKSADDVSLPLEGEVHSRPLFRVIGIILISLSVLLGIYGAVALIAWQRSQDIQAENAQTILTEEINRQLTLARADIDAGNLALALRRLEWILQREPDHPEALAARHTVEQQMSEPTATPRPEPTESVATAQPEPVEDDAELEFARIESLVEDEMWSDAISAIFTFQSEHPNYRRQDTDRILYEAYINLGQELLAGEQVELGLSYLSQAESLGDLPQHVEDQRLWAELYLQGIAYYGVDWGTTIYFFRDLCLAAPFYQDSCQKLRAALIASADASVANMDYCPAEPLYVEASQLERDATLSEKVAAARQNCLEATPTPSKVITDTEDFGGALPAVPTGQASEGNDG